MSLTALEAVRKFKSYAGVKRAKLPWLHGRPYLYDCAAAYCYIAGVRPEFISCTDLKNYCVKKNAWFTDVNEAKRGDAVMFDWEHGGAGLGKNTNTDHVGMVISVDKAKKTVTYVSADATKPTPGLVKVNTISLAWVTGFGRPVQFAPEKPPVAHNPISSALHNTAKVENASKNTPVAK